MSGSILAVLFKSIVNIWIKMKKPEETFNKIVNLYQEMYLTANKIKNLEL